MQVNVSGHHVKVTDSLKKYVEERLQKLDKHFDHVNRVHVVLSLPAAYLQRVEARVEINQASIFAECIDADMYAAIDGVAAKLERQIKRKKEQRRDSHKHVDESATNEFAAGLSSEWPLDEDKLH